MIDWIFEETNNYKIATTLAILIGIAACNFGIGIIAQSNLLPKVNSKVVTEDSKYLGNGAVEEETAVQYDTEKDATQNHINFILTVLLSIPIGIIAFFISFLIIRKITIIYFNYLDG